MELLRKDRSDEATHEQFCADAASAFWLDDSDLLVADPDSPGPSTEPIPIGDVAPCSECGAMFLWLDEGGGHHCPECEEPPSLAMVDRIVHLTDGPTGRLMTNQTDFLMPVWKSNRREKIEARNIAAAAAEPADDF